MRIICKKIDAKDLDLNVVTTIFSNDFDYSFGGSGLQVGNYYVVMGMVLYNNSDCLYYLIDINGTPYWFPSLLFDVIDNSLPFDWFTKSYSILDNSDIHYIWGFDELCNDISFYDKLSDQEENAINIYFKRKSNLEVGK